VVRDPVTKMVFLYIGILYKLQVFFCAEYVADVRFCHFLQKHPQPTSATHKKSSAENGKTEHHNIVGARKHLM
jgi:hypothetical protein